jgi:hypothetical protein
MLARVAALTTGLAMGASAAHADQSAEELAKKLSNPVSGLISVPFQSNVDFGSGDGSGSRFLLNVQPVVPISLSDRWNLISRTIVPIVHQHEIFDGSGNQTGLGDVTQSFFFSPKEQGPLGITWGAGPVLLLDTATDDLLGGDNWGAGPTLVLLRQHGGWTYGALLNHIWGFATDENRERTSTTNWKTGFGVTLSSESTHDWRAHQWTVPINVVASQVLKIGPQRVSVQLGVRCYAEKPDGGPDWGLRLGVVLLYPPG